MECITENGHRFLIDDEDYEMVSSKKWWAQRGYIYTSLHSPGEHYLHRILMNTPEGMWTDHIDHNRSNNQKSNLRVCTPGQNLYNKPKHHGSSKYKGVSWFSRDSKWTARVTVNGKPKNLGYFDKEEDAAREYNRQAMIHYGEFAYLNTI
jgi:hypothetical protein